MLRRQSASSESTRGLVSVRELLNAIDFCAALRSAIIPLDAPVADMLRACGNGTRGEARAGKGQQAVVEQLPQNDQDGCGVSGAGV